MMPMFIILMLFLYAFFVFFMGQQLVAHGMVQAAKSMAFDPYASHRAAAQGGDLDQMVASLFDDLGSTHYSAAEWYTEDGADDLEDIAKERFLVYLRKDSADQGKLLELIGVKDGISGLDFSGSKVENGTLTLTLKYTQEFFFKLTELTSFERVATVKVKLFDWK